MSAAAGAGAGSASAMPSYSLISYENSHTTEYIEYAKSVYTYILQDDVRDIVVKPNASNAALYPDAFTGTTYESKLAKEIAVKYRATKFDKGEAMNWNDLSMWFDDVTGPAWVKSENSIYFHPKILTIRDATNKVTYTLPTFGENITWQSKDNKKIICKTNAFSIVVTPPKVEGNLYLLEFTYIYRNPNTSAVEGELVIYKSNISNELAAALFLVVGIMESGSKGASGGRRRSTRKRTQKHKHKQSHKHKRKTHRHRATRKTAHRRKH
jgi:hypothetical protein